MTTKPLIAALLIVSLAACSDMTPRQQRALSGGAIGTAGGALIGLVTGGVVTGALIGAGTGAAAGALLPDSAFASHGH